MPDIENKTLIAIFGAIAGCYCWLIKILLNGKNVVTKQEFTRLENTVQYKDTCNEVVKRIDEKLDLIIDIIERDKK